MSSQPGPGIIAPSSVDLKGLFTGYNTALAGMRNDNSLIYPKIAFVPGGAEMATMRSQVKALDSGGRMVNAQFLRLPFPMVGKPPKRWEWGMPRLAAPAQVAYIEVELIRWSPDLEELPYDILDNDTFNLISNNLGLMLDRAPRLWDYALADKLASNDVGYDGVAFFQPAATPHLANPNKPALGNYFNDLPIAAIDNASMKLVIDLLEAAPGFDGKVMDSGADTRITIVAPTSTMEMTLKEVFQGSIQAQAVGAVAAATGPNDGLRGKADVVLWKDLRRTTVGGGYDPKKVGYAFASPNNMTRPLIVIPKRMPTACYEGLSPNDRSRIETGGVRYGWDAFGGVEYGLPQRAVRFRLP